MLDLPSGNLRYCCPPSWPHRFRHRPIGRLRLETLRRLAATRIGDYAQRVVHQPLHENP